MTLEFPSAPTLKTTNSVSFDIYTDTDTTGQSVRTYLATISKPTDFTVTSQPFTIDFTVPASFANSPSATSTQLLAYATFSEQNPGANGTSAFSNEMNSTSPTVVYTTADSSTPIDSSGISGITGISGIAGSLRYAINYANQNSGSTITFAIPGSGPFVITLDSTTPQPMSLQPLGAIKASMTIDGTSQPGYAPTRPVVEIDGSLLTSGSE